MTLTSIDPEIVQLIGNQHTFHFGHRSILSCSSYAEYICTLHKSYKRVYYGGRNEKCGMFCGKVCFETELLVLLRVAISLHRLKDTITLQGEPSQ